MRKRVHLYMEGECRIDLIVNPDLTEQRANIRITQCISKQLQIVDLDIP